MPELGRCQGGSMTTPVGPSTKKVAPLVYAAPSESRKTAAAETSSAVPATFEGGSLTLRAPSDGRPSRLLRRLRGPGRCSAVRPIGAPSALRGNGRAGGVDGACGHGGEDRACGHGGEAPFATSGRCRGA